MSIQEVARRSGLTEPTLRYYERVGLIGPVRRDPSSGHRRYSAAMVDRIEAVACLRATGMGIEELRTYLAEVQAGTGRAREIVALLSAQVARLDDELRLVQLRRAYVAAKLSLWQARADGDGAAAAAAAATALDIATELRAGVDRG